MGIIFEKQNKQTKNQHQLSIYLFYPMKQIMKTMMLQNLDEFCKLELPNE